MALRARSAALDLIRVVGIVAIVAGHVSGKQGIREALYTWHVPIFFFLSGYLWRDGRTLASEARNRFRTIGLPYLFWLVAISVVFIPWSLYKDSFPLSKMWRILAGGDYIGRPYTAFWFMSALFAASLIFRLLDRWVWALSAIAIVGLLFAYIRPDLVAAVPLALGVAVPALTFMILGRLLQQYRSRFVHPLLVGISLLLASAVLIATRLSAPLDMKVSNFGTPVLSVAVAVAICAGLVLMSETLVSKLGTRLREWVSALAVGGTVVVLTHPVILWLLGTRDEGSVADFALALIIPWVAALVILRTPLAPLLAGSPRQGCKRGQLVGPA
jgi:acyltransferase